MKRPLKVEHLERRWAMAVFTVVNADDSGAGSFRQAILDAESTPEADSIEFEIATAGPIVLASPLPVITSPVTIDARTQAGYAGSPLVEVRSGNASWGVLNVTADNTAVYGLSIRGEFQFGVALDGVGNRLANSTVVYDLPPLAMSSASWGVLIAGQATVEDNIVGGHDLGVFVVNASTSDVVIQHNQVANNFKGVVIQSAGSTALDGNTISENTSVGVELNGDVNSTVSNNVISGNGEGVVALGSAGTTMRGNRIGVTDDGLAAWGNSGSGIRLQGTDAITIGGLSATDGNVISANGAHGIVIATGTSTAIQGNHIGTDLAGQVELGNSEMGIADGGDYTQIGGLSVGAGNIVSGNGLAGIALGAGEGAAVIGNLVGSDAFESSIIGNGASGILIGSHTNAVIRHNVVVGNGANGIDVNAASQVLIEANSIGRMSSGAAAGNAFEGILVSGNATDISIGGVTAGLSNSIAYNGGSGINVRDDGTQAAILINSVYDNGRFGIDLSDGGLFGVTANDVLDSDIGPNTVLNYPNLTAVTTDVFGTRITGNVATSPLTSLTLRFFSTNDSNTTNGREGEFYVGEVQVITDAAGQAAFAVNFSTPAVVGHLITATATDEAGNTSEFSADMRNVSAEVQNGPFNLKGERIEIVLYGAALFDVTAIDVNSIDLSGAATVRSTLKDIDHDGWVDYVFEFEITDTDLLAAYTAAIAEDVTADGVLNSNIKQVTAELTGSFLGSDEVFASELTLDVFLKGKDLRNLLATL